MKFRKFDDRHPQITFYELENGELFSNDDFPAKVFLKIHPILAYTAVCLNYGEGYEFSDNVIVNRIKPVSIDEEDDTIVYKEI